MKTRSCPTAKLQVGESRKARRFGIKSLSLWTFLALKGLKRVE